MGANRSIGSTTNLLHRNDLALPGFVPATYLTIQTPFARNKSSNIILYLAVLPGSYYHQLR